MSTSYISQNPVRPHANEFINPVVEDRSSESHDPETDERGRESNGEEGATEMDADLKEGEIPTASEAQSSIGIRAPGTPSAKEREDHDRTHLPFREWCDVCVCGQGARRTITPPRKQSLTGIVWHSWCWISGSLEGMAKQVEKSCQYWSCTKELVRYFLGIELHRKE